MNAIQLLDRSRRPVGTITCEASGDTIVTVADDTLAREIQQIVDGAREGGLPLRSGERTEIDGKPVFSERSERVFPADEQFPSALLEAINRTRFSGQRVFGILADRKERHHAGA